MNKKLSTPKGAILVPVDFSAYSEAALLFASELSACLSAPLVVLHVVHDPGEMPGYYQKVTKKKKLEKLEDLAEELFNDFMQKLQAANPKLKPLHEAQRLLVVGVPVTRILEVVDKTHPRMVVMGSQGRTGLSHLLIGSKSEPVVKLCPVPVTIVKTKKKS